MSDIDTFDSSETDETSDTPDNDEKRAEARVGTIAPKGFYIMDQIDEPKLLRVSEVARLFNVSKPTVYRMVNSGRLEGYTICGSVRVPAESVSRYLNSHKITGGQNNTPIKIDTSPTPASVKQDLKSQYISSTKTTPAPPATPATPPATPATPPAPPTISTAQKATLTPRKSAQAQPTAEMILQRKAWKMARTLAVKILPADADSEQWDRTLKFAYEEARKRLQAAARATTQKS